MDAGLRARIEEELPRRGWTPENHAKLVDFLAASAGAREGPLLALFDADNTAWTGDVGDAAFVFMLRNLKLSPRLPDLLPASIDVPANRGFGVAAAGRLFPSARVHQALEAMVRAYRRVLAPSASMPELLAAFSEELILAGGPLHDAADFMGAYRIYTGTLLALYQLLEAEVGAVAFDFADVRPATPLFDAIVRDFYGQEAARGGDLAPFARREEGREAIEILFPAIRDAGADQRALRLQGRLGAYTQVATWVALDKTPSELRRLAFRIWEGSPPVDTAFDVVFPVDAPGAASPGPIPFEALQGVTLGAASMRYGVRARREIVDLVGAMARHGVVSAVVSASHVDLLQPVLERYYGLGSSLVVGMRTVLEGGAYGADLTAPVTYGPGKVDAARALLRNATGREDTRPVFCAGDTTTDLEMVAYSRGYRLFFDRGKQPFMDLAGYLAAHGAGPTTLIQPPFAP